MEKIIKEMHSIGLCLEGQAGHIKGLLQVALNRQEGRRGGFREGEKWREGY